MTSNSLTLSQAASGYASTVSTSARVVVSTEVLYKQKSSKCHGADGSGETSLGRIFNATDFTDGGWWAKHLSGELVDIITRGKKNLPAFERSLIFLPERCETA